MERLKGYNIGSKSRERMVASTSRYLDRIFKSSLLVVGRICYGVDSSCRLATGRKRGCTVHLMNPPSTPLGIDYRWNITDGISWAYLPTLFFIRGSPLSFSWLFYGFGSFVIVSRFRFVISGLLLSFDFFFHHRWILLSIPDSFG